jgi:hypothetical protein
LALDAAVMAERSRQGPLWQPVEESRFSAARFWFDADDERGGLIAGGDQDDEDQPTIGLQNPDEPDKNAGTELPGAFPPRSGAA